MKLLGSLMLALVMTTGAQAAQLQDGKYITHRAVYDVARTYKKLMDKVNAQSTDMEGSYSVTLVNSTHEESWTKIIKQSIYRDRARGSHAIPEEVTVTPFLERPRDIKIAVDRLMDDVSITEDEAAEVREELEEKLATAVALNEVELFVGSDGNSFGECTWIVLTDNNNSEITRLDHCYSE